MTDSAAPEKVPAIGISFGIDLGLGSSLTLQYLVPGDAPNSVLNPAINRLAEQAERMRKRFALPEIERQLKLDNAALADARRGLETLDLAREVKAATHAEDKKRGAYKEDDRTASARVNAKANIESLVERVGTNTKLQAEFTKAAYDDGSDLGTDLRAGA